MDASQSKQELKEATDKHPMLLNAFLRLKNGEQLSLEQAQAVQNILEKMVAHRLRHSLHAKGVNIEGLEIRQSTLGK